MKILTYLYREEIRAIAGTHITIRDVNPSLYNDSNYKYYIKETEGLSYDYVWDISDFQIDENNPIKRINEDKPNNNIIIILVNEYDDALLYLNGKSYQDIDMTWVDCIDYLRDILPNLNIRIIKYPKDRKNFPDIINEEDFKY